MTASILHKKDIKEVVEVSSKIRDAYLFLSKLQLGHIREFAEQDYIKHAEQVSCILARFVDDEDMIVAALLHNIEDKPEEIQEVFGDTVASLVGELTKDVGLEEQHRKERLLERYHKLSNKALTIELSNRLANLSSIIRSDLSDNLVKWYVEETQYMLFNMDRKLNKNHKDILTLIEFMAFYVELIKQV